MRKEICIFRLRGWPTGEDPRQGDRSCGATRRTGGIAAEASFQTKLRLKPQVRWGYLYSPGYDNSYDGTHQAFLQVLPTARIYVRLPCGNLMNNQGAFAEPVLRPHPKWAVRTDAHILRLSNRNDSWYVSGGASQQTNSGSAGRPGHGSQSFSGICDVGVNPHLNSPLALHGYYADATMGTVIERIYADGVSG